MLKSKLLLALSTAFLGAVAILPSKALADRWNRYDRYDVPRYEYDYSYYDRSVNHPRYIDKYRYDRYRQRHNHFRGRDDGYIELDSPEFSLRLRIR